MVRPKKTIRKAARIIHVLGGLRAVEQITGANYTSVCNWKTFNAFPARYYLVMICALRRRGYTAPPKLWDQRGLADEQSEAA